MKTPFILFALLLVSAASFAQSADEKAIKNAIDGESAAFYQRNMDKVLSHYSAGGLRFPTKTGLPQRGWMKNPGLAAWLRWA